MLCVASVALAYGPLAFFHYAETDDYALLMIHGYRAVNPFWIGDGRILGGLLCAALFTVFDTVSSAAVLRLIGLAEFLFCLSLIQRAARSVGLTPLWAGVSALLFAASPSVQNWMVWAVSSWQMPALALGLLAYASWRRMFDGVGQISYRNAGSFIALQVVAMLIYQPFALAAWPFVTLALATELDRTKFVRGVVTSAVAFGLMLAITLAATKGMTALFVSPSGHDRTEIATLAQLPGKAWWLLTVLYLTVLSFVASSPVAAIWGPAVVLLLACVARPAMSPRRAIAVFVVLMGGAIAAALPSLATAETTPLRTFVVPALLACVLVVAALQFLAAQARLPEIPTAGTALMICACLLAWTAFTTIDYVAIPQARELAALDRLLAQNGLPGDAPVVLIGPPPTATLTGHLCGVAMIGCMSSSRPFALPNMVRLWLRDHGQDVRSEKLFFATDPTEASVFSFEPDRSRIVTKPADAHILDLRRIQ